MSIHDHLRGAPKDRQLARLALFTAKRLRNVDRISLRDLGNALDRAADRGRIRPFSDNSELTRIMQRLGWHKIGYAGDGADRSPLYARTAEMAGQP